LSSSIFVLSKLSLRLTFLAAAKATSTGNTCHQLAASTNGSNPITPSMPSLATTSTMTLANDNMVAPSFCATGRLQHQFPLLAWIPWALDAGFGLLYLDGQESPHISSAHTNPVILLLPKPIVSGLSTNPTYSVRMTPAHPGPHSSATLAPISPPGDWMATKSSLWLT